MNRLNRRQRVAIVLLCCIAVLALMLACTSKKYTIIIPGAASYRCDRYSWVSNDLHLFGCVPGGYDTVLLNAANVTIIDNQAQEE